MNKLPLKLPVFIGPKNASYSTVTTDAQKEMARLHGVKLEFEAMSIGNEDGQLCIIPLDDNSPEVAGHILCAVNNARDLRTALCIQTSIIAALIKQHDLSPNVLMFLASEDGDVIPCPLSLAMQRANEVIDATELFK